MRKLSSYFPIDGVWSKVMILVTVLFFVLLSDAILSDWVPVYLQEVLGSPFLMGLVMSFSSLVGFGADLIFPQLLRGTKVNKLLVMAILSGVLFSAILLSTIWWRPVLVLIMLAMGVWGIYYELLGFANQQFVAETVSSHQRVKVWAIIGVFRNLAYFLGPVIGAYLMRGGDSNVVMVAGAISVVAYLLILVFRMGGGSVATEGSHLDMRIELSHWWSLIKHVWPMLLASFTLGLVDATFWTTGTVYTEILSQRSWTGGLFLPFYTLPSLFVGFFVMKWGLYKGKKKWAEVFMLLGGICLASIGFGDSVGFLLSVVFASSVMFSISYPLIDAVYSDIVSRMGKESKHMVGLCSSMLSLAYIAGPITAGSISSLIGEKFTFSMFGFLVVFVSIFLLMTTPKKLLLPQSEIKNWK